MIEPGSIWAASTAGRAAEFGLIAATCAARLSGSSVKEKIVSLVKKPDSLRPGMGGWMGFAPVAMIPFDPLSG